MSNRSWLRRVLMISVVVAFLVILATALVAPGLLVAVAVLLVVIAGASAPRVMRRLGEGSRRSMGTKH